MSVTRYQNSLFDFYRREYNNDFQDSVLKLGLFVILYCTEGKMSVSANKQNFLINSGELLFLPAGSQNITYRFLGAPKHVSLSLGFRVFPNVTQHDYPAQIISDPTGELKELITDIPIEPKNRNGTNITWRFYRFLTLFQTKLIKQTKKHFNDIMLALEYMRTHDCYDVEDLAKYCSMSVTRFHVAFHEITGTTPLKKKHELQAFKAEMLMRSTDLPIEEIVQRVGFTDADHFRKIFKRQYNNKTPRTIRKERGNL